MAWTTPATVLVGDPATSSWANTFVRDNTAWLYGDTAWSVPGAFTNSWANYFDVGYRRVGNTVLLRGEIKGGVSNTVAFTLPSGYAPPAQYVGPACLNDGSGNLCILVVQPSGTVAPYGSAISSSTPVSLDGTVLSLL